MKSSRSATTPDRRLIVFVPELGSLLREASERPALVDAVTKPRAARRIEGDQAAAWLATGKELPAAALTRLRDCPDDAEGAWLRADPIGLTPDLAAVWLQADRRFEPGAWQEALESLMAEEGYPLEFHPSGRGYLRLDSSPDCRFAPPRSLAGNSLEYCLPEGPDARRWRRLLNETQVLLHQHGGDAGTVPGSLWFWGGGRLPSKEGVAPRIERIISDDPVLEGLARWLGLEQTAPPDGQMLHGGTLLTWPVEFESAAEDNLARLGADLRRAWRALRFRRIDELELATDDAFWRYRPLDAWRIWR